jgi:hypothetical protein
MRVDINQETAMAQRDLERLQEMVGELIAVLETVSRRQRTGR